MVHPDGAGVGLQAEVAAPPAVRHCGATTDEEKTMRHAAGATREAATRSVSVPLLGRMATATAALIFAATAVAGCDASDPKPGGTVEIEEVHLDAIRESVPDLEEYTEVTVPRVVKAVVSPSTFTIVDPSDPSVEELLIVHEHPLGGISPETGVKVTGVVYRGFDVGEVEKETGVQLEQAPHDQWQGDSYIVASHVEISAEQR